MSSDSYIALSEKYLAKTYGRFPLVLVRGKDCQVWDADDKCYTDFIAGLSVVNLGHCHPKVVAAIREQAGTLIHVSNFYHIPPQIELAQRLVEASFADRAFFCNSGAEANEAAIKLARLVGQTRRGPECYEIITLENSFHGRTFGALSATGQESYRKGFGPLLPGFRYVPFNDLGAVGGGISKKTCAVLIEPIQGEGGVVMPDPGYLQRLRALCDKEEVLLIFDEVQTGMGRTGKLFAYQHEGVEPDIMTLAKSLAGGTAMGAMLAKEPYISAFSPGTHASTFGGNYVASAAALAGMEVLQDGIVLKNCREMGAYFKGALETLRERHPCIRDVRGQGLMLGMELDHEGAKYVKHCWERGFLINCTVEKVLRFLPPLTIGREAIDSLVGVLDNLFLDHEKDSR